MYADMVPSYRTNWRYDRRSNRNAPYTQDELREMQGQNQASIPAQTTAAAPTAAPAPQAPAQPAPRALQYQTSITGQLPLAQSLGQQISYPESVNSILQAIAAAVGGGTIDPNAPHPPLQPVHPSNPTPVSAVPPTDPNFPLDAQHPAPVTVPATTPVTPPGPPVAPPGYTLTPIPPGSRPVDDPATSLNEALGSRYVTEGYPGITDPYRGQQITPEGGATITFGAGARERRPGDPGYMPPIMGTPVPFSGDPNYVGFYDPNRPGTYDPNTGLQYPPAPAPPDDSDEGGSETPPATPPAEDPASQPPAGGCPAGMVWNPTTRSCVYAPAGSTSGAGTHGTSAGTNPNSQPTTGLQAGNQWVWDPAIGWVQIPVYTPGPSTLDPRY